MKFSFPSLLVLISVTAFAQTSSPKKKAAPKSSAFDPAIEKKITSKEEAPPVTKKLTPIQTDSAGKSNKKITEGPQTDKVKREAAVSSIEVSALADFEQNAPQIQQLIRSALDLTKRNLTYTYGSSDPKQGGMDCSGTIYNLLNSLKIKDVPRQSDEICGWVQERTLLHRVSAAAGTLTHDEFAALQPGDLLFWSGTYTTSVRNIPVTHVMLYLGKLRKTGRHIMFGASDGRVYQGERRNGVSVFDFTLPGSDSASSFYGYGLIPGVGRIVVKAPEPVVTASPVISKETPESAKVSAPDRPDR